MGPAVARAVAALLQSEADAAAGSLRKAAAVNKRGSINLPSRMALTAIPGTGGKSDDTSKWPGGGRAPGQLIGEPSAKLTIPPCAVGGGAGCAQSGP